MKFFLRSNNHFLALLLVFYLLLTFLNWMQLTRQIETDRNATISAAIQHNNNLAIALEQHTIRTIRDADATLQLVKMEYEQRGASFDFQNLANHQILDLPFFSGLVITDTTGSVVKAFPSQLLSMHLNVGDRSHFYVHRTVPDTLVITKPFISRSIQEPVIVMSRRINDAKGRFRGAVAIQLLPSTFMSFYSQASLKKYDILSLISPDGITYSRRTGPIESSGEDIHRSPLFRHVAQKAIGSYYAKDAIRGIPTYFSYRQLNGIPVIATVGSAENDILAPFHQRQWREYIFGGVTSLLLLVFFIALFVGFKERKKSVQILKQSEARYRSIFESSHDAILLLKHDGTVEEMNPAANALFNLSVTEGSNLSFDQLFENAEPGLELFGNGENEFSQEGKEILFHCLNGSKFFGEISCSGFLDKDSRQYGLVLIRDVTQRKRIEQKLQNEQKRYQRTMTKQIIVAQERERESIGHELHDNVNQVLTTVKLYLEMAQQRKDSQRDLIDRSIGYIQQCISEIRQLSHNLSAPTLGTQSLVDSMQVLVENVAKCSGFPIHLHINNYNRPVGKELSLALYRIVQEQLNNIIKHAQATDVTVSLSQTNGETLLSIEDNGKGFGPAAQSNGIGLNNISSRVKAFNGKLSITSAPGAGCRLFVSLPHAEEASMVKANWY